MDPLCHTLLGGALAQSGLKRRTALGTAALVIGANLPDIDAVLYLGDPERALALRRGWTHGVLALALWPGLLTGVLLLWHRAIGQLRRPAGQPAIVPHQLFLLAALAVVSHPVLDSFNTYGMRWLMPFSDRWFYGDILFIADPWVWLILAGGVVFSWWRERRSRLPAPRPARLALALAAGYILVMAGIGLASRWTVARAVLAVDGVPPRRQLASPVPVDPLRRDIVVELADGYHVGTLRWNPLPHLQWQDEFPLLPAEDDPTLQAARADPDVDRFLSWARFPTMVLSPAGRVAIFDLRYVRQPGPGFGTVTTHLDSVLPAPTHVGLLRTR